MILIACLRLPELAWACLSVLELGVAWVLPGPPCHAIAQDANAASSKRDVFDTLAKRTFEMIGCPR